MDFELSRMEIDLSQFRDVFLAECAEHVGMIEEGLLELQQGQADTDRLHAIFRAAHSMKGAAGTFGWTAIVHLTHAMEDLLDRLRSGRMAVTPPVVHILLQALDNLKDIMRQREEQGSEEFGTTSTPEAEALVAQLRGLATGRAIDVSAAPAKEQAPAAEQAPERRFTIEFHPGHGCFEQGIDPLSLMGELKAQGAFERTDLEVDRLPSIEELDAGQCYLGWSLEYRTHLPSAALEKILEPAGGVTKIVQIGGPSDADPAEDALPVESEPLTAATAPPPPTRKRVGAGSPQDAQSIRVPSKKVDQLIDLAGELVIAYSMANAVLASFTVDSLPRLKEAMAAMERGTRDLQERVMSVRMSPAGVLFQRFPRLIYDVASQTGKRIALNISGEDTELDKVIADQLADPLTHLVRNSADHGIESPEVRARAGKPEQGTISLRAYHQGGKVVIEISDDGKGLDVKKIREKAVSRGLITPDAAMSDEEIQQLIFAPGFSTKDVVSDLSGRGVGMDVVKRNVEALSGNIRLESVPGQGMVIRLFLPLTLAIVDGLLLKVGEQSFALPLGTIIESVRPKASQLLVLPGAGTMLMLRQESLPVIELSRVYRIDGAERNPERGLVVIVESGLQKLALLVDDIVGQQQFVIKSVEKNFRRVDGTMGATILGDGKVALIVDVSALQEMAA
jgi:two-component system, chemotaxis family, sensor kinase CheA